MLEMAKLSFESYLNEEKASYLTRYVAFRAFLYKLRPARHFFLLSAAHGIFSHAHAAFEWI
jgi:hypothetical protein